jgi:hypothetical protein
MPSHHRVGEWQKPEAREGGKRGRRVREEREPGGETGRRERKTGTYYAAAAREKPVVQHGFVGDAGIHKFDSDVGGGAVRSLLVSH